MDTPIYTKIAKLTADFIANPRNIPRYISDIRKSPLDLGLPWFSYGAIDFLECYLKPDMTVFEYGSGGSTVFFSKRTARVVSREPDPVWLQRARSALPHAENVEFVPGGHVSSLFDVIIIDHGEAPYSKHAVENRRETFELAERFVTPGGIIVVDDSWRHKNIRKGRNVRVFEGIGPCRIGVTSTDIFFY